MFLGNKNGLSLIMSLIVLVVLSACAQVEGASRQPEGNQETANNPSIALDETAEEAVIFNPVVIFELADIDLKRPVPEIPYYSFGELEYISQENMQSFAEGHSPWRGSPVHAAEILTQNLIPEEVSLDQVSHNLVRVENENQADELTVVEKIISDLGTFTISLKFPPEGGGICYITKIIWQPVESTATRQH